MKWLCKWFRHKWEPDSAFGPEGKMRYFHYCKRCGLVMCVRASDYDVLAEIAAHENARRVHAEARLAALERGLEAIAKAADERVLAMDSHINSVWVASVARETLHKARATGSATVPISTESDDAP
jgi:hypothetical protein